MYFAAGLFLSTGLVAAVVSLVTAPPRDYMVRGAQCGDYSLKRRSTHIS